MNLTTDVAEPLQYGVITALMHIASARMPGAASLASEFHAAQRAIQDRMHAADMPDAFKTAFGEGLSLGTLKSISNTSLTGDRRLLGLRRRELLAAMEQQHRTCYSTLVLAAAGAALRAELEERRWFISRAERAALKEIQSVFDHRDWST